MPSVAINIISGSEESNVPGMIDLLAAIPDTMVHEIVIVVNGQDSTLSRFQKYATEDQRVKVIQSTWTKDFALQRNIALKNTMSDYVLWVDMDDRIDGENLRELAAIVENDLSPSACCMFNIENVGSNSSTFPQVRLFPNIKGVYWEGAVHETLDGSLAHLEIEYRVFTYMTIHHTGYADEGLNIQKAWRNLEILEEEGKIQRSAMWAVNMGKTYTVLKDYERALEWTLEALEYETSEDFRNAIRYDIGKLYELQGRYLFAMEYYHRSGRLDAFGRFANIFGGLKFPNFQDYLTEKEVEVIGSCLKGVGVQYLLSFVDASHDREKFFSLSGNDVDQIAAEIKRYLESIKPA